MPRALTADFKTGLPDLASFPRSDWLWAQRESLASAPTAVFDYSDPRGSTVLRVVLAGYLRRVRAAATDPQLMVICNGFAEDWCSRCGVPIDGDSSGARIGDHAHVKLPRSAH